MSVSLKLTITLLGLHLVVALITFAFVTCCSQSPGKYKDITDPLLKSTDDQNGGEHIIKK